MILHLCSDEKFIDYTVDIFEKYNRGRNTFIVLKKGDLKYVKSKNVETCNPLSKLEIADLKARMPSFEAIIIHYMDYFKSKLVHDLPKSVKLCWFSWGADFYDDPNISDPTKYFEPMTKEYYSKFGFKLPIKERFIFFLKRSRIGTQLNWYWQQRTPLYVSVLQKKKAINRVDYLSTVIPGEFDIVKDKFAINPKYIKWNYGNTKNMIGEFYEKEVELGSYTLVGNSATYTNNHLDVIGSLLDYNRFTPDTRFIFPLSYGDKRYTAFLEKKLMSSGLNFVACKEFMPLVEYRSMLLSCRNMIMFHSRQQAVGNIIMGVYLGMKVFLNPKSIVFKFLQENGIRVYSFPGEFIEEHSSSLAFDQVVINRNGLEKIWGADQVTANVKETLQLIS